MAQNDGHELEKHISERKNLKFIKKINICLIIMVETKKIDTVDLV